MYDFNDPDPTEALLPQYKSPTKTHSKLTESELLGFQTAQAFSHCKHPFEAYTLVGSPNFEAVCDYAHAAYHSIDPEDTKQYHQTFQAALDMIQY